jgi:hypothetical protein
MGNHRDMQKKAQLLSISFANNAWYISENMFAYLEE